MKRLLYFAYYVKNLDKNLFLSFLSYTKEKHGKNPVKILFDVFWSSLRYNISILEYFQFGFYSLNHHERLLWAGTGFMYEYQLAMNPKKHRPFLEDKRLFLEKYKDFVSHDWYTLDKLIKDESAINHLLKNPSGKLVIKSHDGQCGIGVLVLVTDGLTADKLIDTMQTTGNDLAEQYIVQHPDLMKLSPSGLNTIRIYTQLNAKDEVEILGCRIRISINSVIDNLAAGNIAAPIDEETGIVSGPGVYGNITKADEHLHPVTKTPITGFQVPFWKETIEMIHKAALHFKECRTIGWDIAITEKGPELIEGNHDWCKLVWQLPVRKGLKPVLERHLIELKTKKT